MKLEIVFSREKMVENNIIESIFFKTLKETTEEMELRYTKENMKVILYGQGTEDDFSNILIIASQLLKVDWVERLVVSCKLFYENDSIVYEDLKTDYAEMREMMVGNG